MQHPAPAPGIPVVDPLELGGPPRAPELLAGAEVQLHGVGAPSEPRPAVFPSRSEPRPGLPRVVGLAAQSLLLGVVAYLCLFNLSVVRGSSMAPRIHDGDRILIDHLSYLFGDIVRGDIVVLKYPLDPSVDYIKRVIGLPGDEVLLENGRVWVNGEELVEPYVAEQDALARVHLRVKPAHFFVLGDNRPRSSDSREFGLVPQDYIRGKVEVRIWPPNRVGSIDAD